MNKHWRELTSEILCEQIGPVAEIIIDDALDKIDAKQQEMKFSRDYLAFIKSLYKELPTDINRKQLCESLWSAMIDNKMFL